MFVNNFPTVSRLNEDDCLATYSLLEVTVYPERGVEIESRDGNFSEHIDLKVFCFPLGFLDLRNEASFGPVTKLDGLPFKHPSPELGELL